ncbi:hypothetical protein K432DRAFT_387263 [Lepidopterella palustris CBS 459.81]|uniref:Uncharacterized protein n=1 Tax=Lepidopterella palustris CBS 459.81 TaxID=1314670 RepID=A0A8E2DY53_9PEZI|nr:hypothetical protein K432DRAFT_387263 [Lepidopterella palustris CBS 459.81]
MSAQLRACMSAYLLVCLSACLHVCTAAHLNVHKTPRDRLAPPILSLMPLPPR